MTSVPNAENLKPATKGEVRNPKGINGFTYRDDAERDLAMWCKQYGNEVIERLVKDAKQGKGYAMKLVLDRILPVVQKVEVTGLEPPRSPEFLPTVEDQAMLERNGHGDPIH